MDVFNKFYSSVSNTVSQLSGVLPGNPVTREFEATQFIASAGPGNSAIHTNKLKFIKYGLIGWLNNTIPFVSICRFTMENLQRLQKVDQAGSVNICVREETT